MMNKSEIEKVDRQDEIINLKGYELSNIEKDFNIPYFQRKVYSSHVKKIQKSILNGTMFNNLITVIRNSKGSYDVIDGQQRLASLVGLREDNGFVKYDLVLRVIKTSIAPKDVYSKINSGKSITAYDMTKSLDDGTSQFFTMLREMASHYPSKNRITYWNTWASYKYATKKDIHPTFAELSSESLANIPKSDIEKIRKFLLEVFVHFGNCENREFKVPIFRNLMRIYFEDGELSKDIVEAVRYDKIIDVLKDDRNVNGYTKIYERLRELSGKQ